MLRKVGWVHVPVSDLDRAAAFYRDTLGLAVTFRDDSIGWLELETEGTTLAPTTSVDGTPGGDSRVTFAVSEVGPVYEALSAKGVTFSSPPAKQPWGAVMATMLDPDDNQIYLLGDS